MLCCSGSLSSPSRGSVACVSRILDSGGGQARLPCRISGAVGLRVNHGKRPFARKSHSWTLAIGSYRTSLVDIAPAMKASGATYPCAHAQVDEKAGNVSGCVAESACCRKLSAQPCQHSNHHYLFRWPMKPSLRHAGNHSGFLVRFNRLRLEFTLIAGTPSSLLNPLRRTPLCRDVLLRLPWLRHTRSEPGSSGKARKTFAAQNSGPAGFSLDSLPLART